MGERREKLEIIKDILDAIRAKGGEIKPTHLLYKSNLSHDSMKRYVAELVEKEMMEELQEKRSKKYTITNKGLKFLTSYQQIREFTDSFGF
tara:strand:- start:1821 stop:2093 length:273 start_codon:yes stop_codon:yes gene_type:complete